MWKVGKKLLPLLSGSLIFECRERILLDCFIVIPKRPCILIACPHRQAHVVCSSPASSAIYRLGEVTTSLILPS
jgi:hypothetical protein